MATVTAAARVKRRASRRASSAMGRAVGNTHKRDAIRSAAQAAGQMPHGPGLDLEDVAGIRDGRHDVRIKRAQVCDELFARNQKKESVAPFDLAGEAKAGRPRHDEPGPDAQGRGEIRLMRVVRKTRRAVVEESEVLARVRREQQVDAAHRRERLIDGFVGEHRVDLIPESAALVLEDDAEFNDIVDARARRHHFAGLDGEPLHRRGGLHVGEPELLQRVLNRAVDRANDVHIARQPGKRRDVEVVRVLMRDDDRIERRELVGMNHAPGAGDDRAVLERIELKLDNKK